MAHPLNKTLAYEDLELPEIQPTFRSLKRWVRNWCLRGHKLGVNGHSKRRWRVRHQKMWEYSRGLALTKASAPERGEAVTHKLLVVLHEQPIALPVQDLDYVFLDLVGMLVVGEAQPEGQAFHVGIHHYAGDAKQHYV